MASKMRVPELRAALEERGLDTTGVKAALVARLEKAMEDEEDDDFYVDDDEPPSKRVKPDTESMTVAQLRSALKERGLSTTGLKAELIARLNEEVDGSGDDTATLSNDASKDASATTDVRAGNQKKEKKENLKLKGKEKEKEKEVDAPKIVTATKKGRAVLDKFLPAEYLNNYHVLEIGADVYDATLNQTNISNNNNKFYVIQALESDDKRRYCTFFRWGRVGENGRFTPTPFSCAEDAISSFESKFREKTKNNWMNRNQFVSYPGKYTLIEMDYGDDSDDDQPKQDKVKENPSKKETAVVPKGPPKESKLDKRVEKFISLICNITMMRQQMVEIGYNAEKLPLGKLSKSTIMRGYEVLKRIAVVIESGGARRDLEDLSNEFYTVIPHDFGRRSIRDQTIASVQHLKDKVSMVEALGEIELASKILNQAADEEDPAYMQYKQLRCNMDPLEKDSEEFHWISKYLENTHADTHRSYDLKIEQIFKVEKDGESSRYEKYSNIPNRMLLWHGSRLTNWTGILSQGLRIAPPEAPVTGYMFGKGVYFADMVSKSANYCFTTSSEPTGVLLLCEVALGAMNELLHSDYNADKLPPGKLSTKGVGLTAPDDKQSLKLGDGVIVPLGQPKAQQSVQSRSTLLYNEYIVYDTSQVKMRYVLQVRFNYKRGACF